jgi:hypothetical protein
MGVALCHKKVAHPCFEVSGGVICLKYGSTLTNAVTNLLLLVCSDLMAESSIV